MTVEAYPLHWPPEVPRTPESDRRRANFSARKDTGAGYRMQRRLTCAEAMGRLLFELERLGAINEVVSSNVALRLDGLPRSGQQAPDDPGVAVYWLQANSNGDHEQRCIPCDRWNRAEDNIAAVAAAIGAMRGLDRWVNDHTVQAAFSGFKALPEAIEEDWRAVLQVPEISDLAVVERAYRKLASRNHPDRPGGSHDQMARINKAWRQAQEALR